jgi:hypothetical protein
VTFRAVSFPPLVGEPAAHAPAHEPQSPWVPHSWDEAPRRSFIALVQPCDERMSYRFGSNSISPLRMARIAACVRS